METSPSFEALLRSGDARTWDDLVESVGPAAMLVRIERRMGEGLRSRLTAEDVWQETLLHAWRDRERHEWRGVASFRRWLLEIAENRIRDAADHSSTLRRGARIVRSVDAARAGESHPPSSFGGVFSSSTPSRHATHREQAEVMRRALEQVPELQREVLWRRLFEEQGLDEIAAAMNLSHAAVKHRLRKGSLVYRERLRALFRSPSDASAGNP
jgi:RNA polymerase sigma factor (sigma-70 family)